MFQLSTVYLSETYSSIRQNRGNFLSCDTKMKVEIQHQTNNLI